MRLQPPLNGEYVSLEELLNAAQTHAAKEGYALIKKRSQSRLGVLTKCVLLCDRGGEPRRPSY